MIKVTDDRLDAIVDLLQGHTAGLRIDEISTTLGLSYWATRKMMQVLNKTHRAEPVHLGHGHVVWATPRNAAPLNAKLRAETRERSRLQRRKARERNAQPAAPAKLYDSATFDDSAVRDLPVVQRVTCSWAPIRQAPGPTSVFDWINHA
jgi:hypothetical protein